MAALVLSAGILLVLGAERNVQRLGANGARRLRAVESVASGLDSARAACDIGVPVVIVPASVAVAVDGHILTAQTLLACAGP
jgi:hypothetical protein